MFQLLVLYGAKMMRSVAIAGSSAKRDVTLVAYRTVPPKQGIVPQPRFNDS